MKGISMYSKTIPVGLAVAGLLAVGITGCSSPSHPVAGHPVASHPEGDQVIRTEDAPTRVPAMPHVKTHDDAPADPYDLLRGHWPAQSSLQGDLGEAFMTMGARTDIQGILSSASRDIAATSDPAAKERIIKLARQSVADRRLVLDEEMKRG